MGVSEQTASAMFEGQSSDVKEISKTLCSNVYKLEHTEKFEAEFIYNLVKKND